MTLCFCRTSFVALAATLVVCLTARESLAASPNVTYMASGTFASPPVSGNDLFQLQGQPFSISIVANESLVSQNHGPQWAVYNKLKMVGSVQSRLLPTPINISNNLSSILLAVGNPTNDLFNLGSPVNVIGIVVSVKAYIVMPKGTIGNDHVKPFTAPVTLTPGNATMTYSDGTETTTLAINGTLTATAPGGEPNEDVQLHRDGARAITAHADGTQSVRPLGAGAVDLQGPTDVVALQLYASGVRDAQEVHVKIDGEEVPILYAGAAGRFSGLDEVSVRLPPSLAGRGEVEVLLTADGKAAKPVHLRIQ